MLDARIVITRPNSLGFDPSIVVETPSWLSRWPKLSTSASRGRFLSVSGSSVRSAQGRRVRAAFLAPEMGILPSSLFPPRMTILSMRGVLRDSQMCASRPDFSRHPGAGRDLSENWSRQAGRDPGLRRDDGGTSGLLQRALERMLV